METLSVTTLTLTLASLVLALLAVAIHQHYKNQYTYWEKRNIKGVKYAIPVLSEMWDFLMKNSQTLFSDRVKALGKVHGSWYFGLPVLYVADAEVLSKITIEDFDSFQNHIWLGGYNRYQANSLYWLRGERWKHDRSLMTPAFTSLKIKRMQRLLQGCAQRLLDNVAEQFERANPKGEKSAILDLYETLNSYPMDCITTCGYGVSLSRSSESDSFARDARRAVKFSPIRLALIALIPEKYFEKLGLTLISNSSVKPLADRIDSFINHRLRNPGLKQNDLMQSLIDARLADKMDQDGESSIDHSCASKTNDHSTGETQLSDEMTPYENGNELIREDEKKLSRFALLSELMFLMSSGTGTTHSLQVSLCFFLAHNQHVQERLYRELLALCSRDLISGEVSFGYDDLNSCGYLDAVISETLRMFTPIRYTDREANKDYFIEKYNIHVEKGTRLALGLDAIHRDPDYWEKPEKFDPDRFLPGRKENIIPGSYIPFLTGPQHCLAFRFALIGTKFAIAHLLMNYRFKPAPGTRYPPVPCCGVAVVKMTDSRVCVARR